MGYTCNYKYHFQLINRINFTKFPSNTATLTLMQIIRCIKFILCQISSKSYNKCGQWYISTTSSAPVACWAHCNLLWINIITWMYSFVLSFGCLARTKHSGKYSSGYRQFNTIWKICQYLSHINKIIIII